MKLVSILLILTCGAAFAETEERINKKFEATPGGQLIVDVEFGAIDVASNATSEVTVEVWRKITRKNKADEEQFLRDHLVKFSQDGNTIIVRCRYKEQKRRWFNWSSNNNRNEAKYTVRVPAAFNAKLDTSGGPIVVNDLTGMVKADTSGGGLKFERIHGPLDGDTSGGSIRVTDCEGKIKMDTSGGGIEVTGGGGSLNADTSGGSITVRQFNGPASVDTSGGGITIENVNGKITGDTSGGHVNAVLISPIPGDVKLSTSGGGMTVKIPADAAFTLHAETSGGGVSCDLPITIQGKWERNELKGTVNGGGPSIELENSGGGIHVRKL